MNLKVIPGYGDQATWGLHDPEPPINLDTLDAWLERERYGFCRIIGEGGVNEVLAELYYGEPQLAAEILDGLVRAAWEAEDGKP